MEVVYRNYTELTNWDKNESAREISTDNWAKLLLSIRREGIKTPFKVDENGIVYDGNNRLKGIREITAGGTTTAENGKDLLQVPCILETPTTEAQKWDLALSGNEQFASWNQDGLTTFLPEFENDLDLSLYNVDFFEPESMLEQIEEGDGAIEGKTPKTPKEVECPECHAKFTPS